MGRKKRSREHGSAISDFTEAVGSSSQPYLDAAWVKEIRRKLLDWYEGACRDLPWRRDRDPYRILVSETMLVQTTVAAVIPYFGRFLERFPTIQALAQAEEADVLKAWEGLGYYRRAKQLHGAAKAVMRDHDGVIPDEPAALIALPGIGRYITGAILSFAFDRPEPIVEANTQRVLARWLAIRSEVKNPAVQKQLWEAAAMLVPQAGAGAFNQAFMELGALVCTPKSPSCLVCPVSMECRARAMGLQDVLPVSRPKQPPLASGEAAALVFRHGRVLIVRRKPGGLWEGFWEFPTLHVSGANPAGRVLSNGQLPLKEGLELLTGAKVEVGTLVKTVVYSVTKYRVTLEAYIAQGLSEPLSPGLGLDAAVWEHPERLRNHSFSSAGRKLIDSVLRLTPEIREE